ncbi:MAG: thioredoxin domain-containing protein [Cyanobacteria bacterium J06606_4]
MSFANAMPTLKDNDHVLGSLSATLLMMTYGSYPCPKTGLAHDAVQNLRSTLGDQFCFIFRHFPTVERYPQSQKTAETAEAAGSQGKFWEMHNKLFDNRDALDDASLVQYADELGLEINQFLQELANHVHLERIHTDVDSALQYGVSNTPTFFISVRHEGTENLEDLVKQIMGVAIKNESKTTDNPVNLTPPSENTKTP